ncbi:hypothetical protein FI667_g9544, partial [Globisporangium splendens]
MAGKMSLLLLRVWAAAAVISAVDCHAIAERSSSVDAPLPPSPLLLIVGDVTPTSARILFDRVPHAEEDREQSPQEVHVRVHVSSLPAPGTQRSGEESQQPVVYELQQEFAVDGGDVGRPALVRLRDLVPNRMYRVGLRTRVQLNEEIVRFRTPVAPHPEEGANDIRVVEDRVIVVSCDRYVDDKDDTLWIQIAADIDAHPLSYFGMAHLGDQVYVDAGAASIPIVPVAVDVVRNQPQQLRERYERIVDQFRALYRETFGRPVVQRALRVGAHWMIPDDHEVINNFNLERVQAMLSADRKVFDQESDLERLFGLALHYRAGLQAFYEYQYQLQHDFPFGKVDFLLEPLNAIVAQFPMHFAVEVHNLKLFFMDTRYDRSFFTSQVDFPKLIGDAQMTSLAEHLERWSQQNESAVMVLSSVPLFFHSTFSAAVTYMVEKETYPGLAAQLPGLEKLFHLFFHYSQPIANSTLRLLVGGDVHFLAHSRVCSYGSGNEAVSSKPSPGRPCFDQLITSGATKGSTAITDFRLVPFYYLVTRLSPLVHKLLAWMGMSSHPWEIEYDKMFLGRNYGVIELSPNGTFQWTESVVVPHEAVHQGGLQGVRRVWSGDGLALRGFRLLEGVIFDTSPPPRGVLLEFVSARWKSVVWVTAVGFRRLGLLSNSRCWNGRAM